MSSRKKVIFVNRFFYPDHSATSQILTDLAFDLAADGTDVEIVTSRLRYDDPGAELPAFESVQGVKIHRVRTSCFGRTSLAGRALDYLTFYASAAWRLWERTNHNSVVVTKTDPPLLSLIAAPVARLRGAKQVNWLQDLFPEVAKALGVRIARGPVLSFLRWARNATLRSAQTNVVLGSRMEALVMAQDVPAAQVRVIPNWADGEAIQPVAREGNPLREAWGLQDRFVVGYSGNLGRAHEFDTILDVAEALKDRPEVVFLFIGGGAQRATVEQKARSRNLTNVQFEPYQPRERLSESLGVADLHLASLNPALEGLIVPSKFYGIAAAGRATLFVGDPDGEIARILREAACGYAVSSGDAGAMSKCIEKLMSDESLREQMGCNARTIFDEKFERKLAVRAWKEVLGLD